MADEFLNRFDKARRVSVPIVVVNTADQQATLATIVNFASTVNHPVVQWDAARGVMPTGAMVPKPGTKELMPGPARARSIKVLEDKEITGANTIRFAQAMVAAERLPDYTILVCYNAHRQLVSNDMLQTATNVQGVANLRDMYKRNFRMLVLLCTGPQVPLELSHDVVSITHELPNTEQLGRIVRQLHTSAQLEQPTPERQARYVSALSGLSDFAAEQAGAQALTETGMDENVLWENKRHMVSLTPGLSVFRGEDRFADLEGLDHLKYRMNQAATARTPVGVSVWLDEGSDAFANVENDNTNVKTDQQRVLLMAMEEYNWRGMILTGVAGAGKSAISKAFGNEAGVPTVAMDMGAMEDSLVGNSEKNIRHVIEVIRAMGQGNAFFLFTCNSLRGVRPQFQARFRKGTFFLDLPGDQERARMWQLYVRKYGLTEDQLVGLPGTKGGINDAGWVGREIRGCVEDAWDNGSTIAEAARHIIPVSLSRGEEMKIMRLEANGRFLDATKFGPYTYTEIMEVEQNVRAIRLAPPTVASVAQGPTLPS